MPVLEGADKWGVMDVNQGRWEWFRVWQAGPSYVASAYSRACTEHRGRDCQQDCLLPSLSSPVTPCSSSNLPCPDPACSTLLTSSTGANMVPLNVPVSLSRDLTPGRASSSFFSICTICGHGSSPAVQLRMGVVGQYCCVRTPAQSATPVGQHNYS